MNRKLSSKTLNFNGIYVAYDRMKYTFLPGLLLSFLTTGCSDDTAPVIRRVSSIEAFDVGNVGDASDIRVRIKLENIAGVEELRIMLVPESVMDDFTTNQAVRLSEDQYFSLEINSTEQTYSERLASIVDTEGDRVGEDLDYEAAALVVGDQLTQLSSLRSNMISLSQNAIFAGTYEGSICCMPKTGGGLNMEDRFFRMEITGNASVYRGLMAATGDTGIIYTASVEFQVEKEDISYFRIFNPDPVNVLRLFQCFPSEIEVGLEGVGTIVQDLTLNVEFPPCESDRERYLIVRRVL